MNAFAYEVLAFAKLQTHDNLAKILGFFHLAASASSAEVEFQVGPEGDVTLSIRAEKAQEH